MSICETPDFMFPMMADVYYPITETTAYGNVTKTWILDKTIVCSFNEAGVSYKEDIKPDPDIKTDMLLLGRVKKDIRISSLDAKNATTNVVITNIRDRFENPIYLETSGPRNGKSTLFEIASQAPFVNPFGTVEYHKVVLRRSENQGVDV
jgi:hypothetical protein